jgi:hypothetical protein
MSENDVGRPHEEIAHGLAGGVRDWGLRTTKVITEWGSRLEIQLKEGGSGKLNDLRMKLKEKLDSLDQDLGFQRLFFLQDGSERYCFLVSWLTKEGAEEFLRRYEYNEILSLLEETANLIRPVQTFRLLRVLVRGREEDDEDKTEIKRLGNGEPKQLRASIDDWYLKPGSELGTDKRSFAERFEKNRYKWLKTLALNDRFFGGIVAYSLDHMDHYQVITGYTGTNNAVRTGQEDLKVFDNEATNWATGPVTSNWMMHIEPRTLVPESAGMERPSRT